MKPTHIVLFGLILMLIGFIAPRILHSFGLGLGIIFMLCYVIGLLMLIIGGLRQAKAKKTGSDV
jgi:hypothetical protein